MQLEVTPDCADTIYIPRVYIGCNLHCNGVFHVIANMVLLDADIADRKLHAVSARR
jgi:hypothetical protein